jgi:FtsH-binding integral membrane protein
MNTTYEQAYNYTAGQASPSERAAFMRRTYAHLAGAVLVFMVVAAAFINSPVASLITATIANTPFAWLFVLLAFMGVSTLANWWAHSNSSPVMQYLGLGLYILAEAVIFTPLLYIADGYFPGAIENAGIATIALFGALTAIVLYTRRDFSFLGPILMIASFVALGVIVGGIIFGFTLGVFFSAAMILFAAGAILYSTSNILHHYRTDQHVAASLSLFASVALLFWYLLQFFMLSRDE